MIFGSQATDFSQWWLTHAINQAIQDEAELVIVSVLEKDDMNVYQALSKDFVHGEGN